MSLEMLSNSQEVSVIVPTYNRAHLLMTTIPTYIQPGVCEVIVVDDGSSDATEAVVRELQHQYQEIRYERQSSNAGQCAANNRGIAVAKGNYVYFGDDDSILTDGAISYLLNCLRDKDADIASARAVYMNPGESVDDALARTRHGPGYLVDIEHLRFAFNSDPDEIVEVPCAPACCIMTTDLARQERFDPIFNGNGLRQETDFQLRCAAKGARIIFCPKAIAINLPRNQAGGGSWSMNWLNYEMCAIRNNWTFLKRHHTFLSTRWGIRKSAFGMQLEFIIRERANYVLRNMVKRILGDAIVFKIRERKLRGVKDIG